MDKEKIFEYVEETDKREIMELLDAVTNRFRELHADRELILLSLPTDASRKYELDRIIAMLQENG